MRLQHASSIWSRFSYLAHRNALLSPRQPLRMLTTPSLLSLPTSRLTFSSNATLSVAKLLWPPLRAFAMMSRWRSRCSSFVARSLAACAASSWRRCAARLAGVNGFVFGRRWRAGLGCWCCGGAFEGLGCGGASRRARRSGCGCSEAGSSLPSFSAVFSPLSSADGRGGFGCCCFASCAFAFASSFFALAWWMSACLICETLFRCVPGGRFLGPTEKPLPLVRGFFVRPSCSSVESRALLDEAIAAFAVVSLWALHRDWGIVWFGRLQNFSGIWLP